MRAFYPHGWDRFGFRLAAIEARQLAQWIMDGGKLNWYVASCGHPVPIHCSQCDPPPTNGVTDTQLAVLFRQTQWALDDAAYEFPAGQVTPRRREELAGILESLATIVRDSLPDGEPPAIEPPR